MRTQFPKIMSGLLMVVLMSCADDPEDTIALQPAVIQFLSEGITIPEASEEGNAVVLSFNRTTAAAGTIKLRLEQSKQHRIQTNPQHVDGVLSLPVAKGVNQVQFSVKAIDNAQAEGDQTITISIVESTGFTLGEQKTIQLVIEDDDTDEDPNPVVSRANFVQQSGAVNENQGSVEYKILLTPAVAIDSKIVVVIDAANSDTFVTHPASENNWITLSAPAGTTELSFTLEMIDNAEITGNTELKFSLGRTEGSIILGTQVVQNVTISDDELAGKLKGYEITSSEGSEKRTYEYDSKGRISKVIKESLAPHYATTQTDTYFYDAQDRVIKINKWLGRDVIYTWSNNQIVRADVYQDDELKQYANYAYDDHGNLAGVEPFIKKPDGSFKDSGITIYLYFTNGNLYKALTYNSSPNQEVLWTTRTYDQYLSMDASVAIEEVLPNANVPKKLPGTYRFENHAIGQDKTYLLTYEFTANGSLSKRTASAPGDTQVTVYHYY